MPLTDTTFVAVSPSPILKEALIVYIARKEEGTWENTLELVFSKKRAKTLLWELQGEITPQQLENLAAQLSQAPLPEADPGPTLRAHWMAEHKQHPKAMKVLTGQLEQLRKCAEGRPN